MIGASYEMFLSCRSFVIAIAVTSLLQLAMCMRTSGFQPSRRRRALSPVHSSRRRPLPRRGLPSLRDGARGRCGKLREELGFDLREIDITGDPVLEAEYREWLPVVEIDGRRRFTYHVQPDAFRRAVAQAGR